MKKLEPGMLCRVVGLRKDSPRHVVTLVSMVGRQPPLEPPNDGSYFRDDDWWLLDSEIRIGIPGANYIMAPYCRAGNLQPINPDHQPADEEWQAYFKRMLCGDRQTVKGGA